MINFVMVDPKGDIADIDDALEDFNLRNVEMGLEGDSSVEWVNIDQIAHHAYHFEVQFKNERKYDFFMSFGSYRQKQLLIQINPIEDLDSYDDTLQNLKFSIKNTLKKEWELCVWLDDSQSQKLAEILYSKIHNTENLLRKFINLVMVKRYGITWWDDFVPSKIKLKYSSRFIGYKRDVPSFRNVSDHLLSIDVDDLIEIMGIELKKFDPEEDIKSEVTKILREQSEYPNDEKRNMALISLIRSNMKTYFDLWESEFSKYLPVDFKDKWKIFNNNRNHIAHNKLLDKHAYDLFLSNIEEMQNVITNAISTFNHRVQSQEEQDLQREEYEEYLHDIMQEQSGVTILDDEEIQQKLHSIIDDFIWNIKSSLFFRDDLILETGRLERSESTLLVLGNQSGKEIRINADVYINDEQGAESSVKLELSLNTATIDVCQITYQNGAVELNEDQAYYMPVVEDELDLENLDEFGVRVLDVIEREFPVLSDEEEL